MLSCTHARENLWLFACIERVSNPISRIARLWLYHPFHWQCYTLKIHQIQKLKFLGTNSNSTKISIWICTARFREIWVSRCGGFWGFSNLSGSGKSGLCYTNSLWLCHTSLTLMDALIHTVSDPVCVCRKDASLHTFSLALLDSLIHMRAHIECVQ